MWWPWNSWDDTQVFCWFLNTFTFLQFIILVAVNNQKLCSIFVSKLLDLVTKTMVLWNQDCGSYSFFKREEQNNRTGSQTEQEKPGKHQQCHLSPVLQPVSHCQRNRRNWLMNTGKPPGQKFPLQRAGSTVCWNRQQNETLKDLKTLKLDKIAKRGVKAADDPRQ